MPTFSPEKRFPDEQIGSLSIPKYGYVTQREEETFQEIYGEYSKDVNTLQVLTDELAALSQDADQADKSIGELIESNELAEVASKGFTDSINGSKPESKNAKITELQAQINEVLIKVKATKFVNKMVGFFLRSRVDPEWTDDAVFENIPSFYTNKIYGFLTAERDNSFLQEPVLENQEIQNTSLTESVEQTGQESS